MARSKSHKDEEDLRGKLREIEKENRALRRRLKKLERSKHIWEEYSLDADERPIEETSQNETLSCSSCKTGTLLLIDLGIRNLWCCSACGYRKTTLK